VVTPQADTGTYRSESVYEVVLQKSVPTKIRQTNLNLYVSDDKGYVDGFVRELTFAKRLNQHFL
jgi:hypothetical protein